MSVSPATPKARRFARACLFAGAALISAALSACGGLSAGGALGADQRILATCVAATPPASLIEIDGTGFATAPGIEAERMAVVESVVRQTAICSGQLRVTVFSSSSVASTLLFDGSLHLDGATDNARLRRVPQLVSSVMGQIQSAYGPAISKLDQSDSDPTGQYRLAGEWIAQLGNPYHLHLYLLTDGFQTTGIDMDAQDKPLSRSAATQLADTVVVPLLPGSTIVVAGLGRVAGKPPHSDLVEGMVTFYSELCRRTQASSCTTVSDYAAAGQ
ncbi:MAG: hypothetical protein JWM85_1685 [Acidimicrobiaceae bacterium]|nr:hypothetical protein [Acidimicrobiaceae bacterium]